MNCPSCNREMPKGSHFCCSCGAEITPAVSQPTEPFQHKTACGETVKTTPDSRSWPSDSTQHGRFLPGTLLAGRYRIVGLLGTGGMGEVYRADDLKLGQSVALKFLPERVAGDPRRLEYFHNEARLARQVSHPNVCRVYDIGEADGQHFLSMEYVDGEDLASLVRRIGRLPPDKGIEIARQLCAGLAAAHDKGVLHRDLKPANVMLDGRGRVRITDFGLARLTDEKARLENEKRGTGVHAGTPQYMAPEQLSGREATERSDLYSLGLLLFEIFTSKPAFQGDTVAELSRTREQSLPKTPSSIVEGIDPAVERVILRCLAKDPRERPASALAVAAALPGGDPLAAALAAGETPSPEMVAAAGASGVLRPAVGVACFVALLLGLGAVAFLSDKASVLGRVHQEMKPPDVLEDTARDIIRELGYAKPATGKSAYGFEYDEDCLRYATKEGLPGRCGAAAMYLWYRESPQFLCPVERFASVVSHGDPPESLSGMVSVRLDGQGRLLEFHAVPPAVDESKAGQEGPDWSKFFELAGLEQGSLSPAGHGKWSPPLYADHFASWEGKLGDSDIRVEAAACCGEPVYFQVIWPEWTTPKRKMSRFRRAPGSALKSLAGSTMLNVLSLIVLVAAGLLTRRNLRMGRSNRKGAVRIALYLFSLGMFAWLFGASHVLHLGHELELFFPALIWNVYAAVWLLLVYLALEPYVRRLWPETLISWSRLLSGKFRDPLVGRDLLMGAVVGVCWAIMYPLAVLLSERLGMPTELRRTMVPGTLLAGRYLLAQFLHEQQYAIVVALNSLLVLLLLRSLVRNQWLAGVLFVLVWTGIVGVGSGSYIYWLTAGVFWGAVVVVLIRSGLLAYVAALVCFLVLRSFPITADLSAWYWGSSLFALAAVAALGAYGLYTSLAGRRGRLGLATAET